MKKNGLNGKELTGIVTMFYSEYCYNLGIEGIANDGYRSDLVKKFKRDFEINCLNPHHLMDLDAVSMQGILNVAFRNKEFDKIIQRMVDADGERDIVNLGCGFDTRFFRLKGYRGLYTDIDYYNVVHTKRELLPKNNNYQLMGCTSVTDDSFFEDCKKVIHGKNPVFISEGLFCYIPFPQLTAFVKALFETFPDAVLICDVFLFSQHLVFDDVKSRVLLKHPEDGEERYQKGKKWYDAIERRIGVSSDNNNIKLANYVRLTEKYEPTPDDSVCCKDDRLIPQYWIGVYERG